MDIKYILKIFIVVFLILSLIAFINSIGLNLNEPDIPKKLLKVVTIEGLTPALSSSTAFCDVKTRKSNSRKLINVLLRLYE